MFVGGVLREGIQEGHVECDVDQWTQTRVLPAITREGEWAWSV